MMDDLDKALLNGIQSNFPICERPFAHIGESLGMDEEEVLSRLKKLKDADIIRRIGGNFGPENLGYFSTLCAAKVPEEKIELFTEIVNRYPGVTHHYIRENDWNLWFTFIEPSREIIADNLDAISRETGVKEILNLPATNVFKIRAEFAIK